MEKVLEIGAWLVAHYQEICGALVAVCLAIDGILVILPGKDPVIFKNIANFLSKFSVKQVTMGEEPKKK